MATGDIQDNKEAVLVTDDNDVTLTEDEVGNFF